MAFSGLRENIMLTKIVLSTDGTNGCVKGDTWCQKGGLAPPNVGPYLPLL